jgi:hypothetical protein
MTPSTRQNLPSTFVPPIVPPTIGGVYHDIAWTGGKPDAGWTKSANQTPNTPFAMRMEGEKAIKTYARNTTGRSLKFKRDDPQDSLHCFAEDAATHMEQTGMDSVFYFADPVDPTRMLDLFESHMHFTPEAVRTSILTMKASNTYDSYDLDNLKHSRTWLENSVDPTLWNSIRPQITREHTGPDLFMTIVAELQSDSIQSMRAKERKFEALKLKDYPGENVKLLNTDILLLVEVMEKNRSLPIDALLTIVDKYTESASEDFRVHFMQRRSAVEAHIKSIAGKSPLIVSQMVGAITPRSLVLESNAKMQSLKDTGPHKWPATATANDKGGAPDFMAHMAKLVESQVSAVLQQRAPHRSGYDKSQVVCYNCNEPGHLKRDCPKEPASSWKKTAPAAGDAQTKFSDGRNWHWCGVCNRWSSTHGTVAKGNVKGHNGPPPRGSSGPPVSAPTPAPEAAPTPDAPPVAEMNAFIQQSLLGNFSAW